MLVPVPVPAEYRNGPAAAGAHPLMLIFLSSVKAHSSSLQATWRNSARSTLSAGSSLGGSSMKLCQNLHPYFSYLLMERVGVAAHNGKACKMSTKQTFAQV